MKNEILENLQKVNERIDLAVQKIQELEQENQELKRKLVLMRCYIYGSYDLEYKEMQLKHIDEYGEELK